MTLPLPGSPAASWGMFWERTKQIFHGAPVSVCIAFWLFGLINNVLYVIILTAALDLVGPNVPKGVVLLADVLPSFFTKLCAPYFIHVIPYHVRIIAFAGLSACGMLLISLTPSYTDFSSISTKMAGVVLASLSSGGGELSFLGLTHFYGPMSLAAWGSGTGGAGLIGAGAYALATTSMGFSVRATLLASACLPAVMMASFFLVLPREALGHASIMRKKLSATKAQVANAGDNEEEEEEQEDETTNPTSEMEGLLGARPEPSQIVRLRPAKAVSTSAWAEFKANLKRSRSLFFPFMLPLLLVYVAEYTINQGVAPTLLFPLSQTPFKHYRAFYPAYNAIYQGGVFISRSSTPFFRINDLYAPSFLQVANLLLLSAHGILNFIPNVYIVFVIVFWEGLLGGLVYVNTFAEISDRVAKADREFSLGATTVSDSAGICIAGFVSMVFEVWLCDYQVSSGRDYCRRI